MKKPARRRAPAKPKAQAHLLGLGLDNQDGPKRITTAETHEKMTETVVKTFETLKTRRKHLHTVEPQELAEIIHKSTPQ